MLRRLLSSGYLPYELPPAFTAETFSDAVCQNRSSLPSGFTSVRRQASLCHHSISQKGLYRRRAAIPNPVLFFNLCEAIADNWDVLSQHIGRSNLTKSAPVPSRSPGRALVRQYTHGDLVNFRSWLRTGARYVLNTDIAKCYPSVYTHSVPWALHGKQRAKANRTDYSLLGNVIDRWIRNGQDQQTVGIPIGPDSSLVVIEVILAAADRDLEGKLPAGVRGIRYVDDYEFGFTSYTAAEEAIGVIQGILHEYELTLNAEKTRITDLPTPLEEEWVDELRDFGFRSAPSQERRDVITFFSKAFRHADLHPRMSVLKYAVQRIWNQRFDLSNWDIVQEHLLHCLIAETSTFEPVLSQLVQRYDHGYPIDYPTLESILNSAVESQCPLGHGSEVAWALYALIRLGIPLDQNAARVICRMEDPVVALLALDALHNGLVPGGLDTSYWEYFMRPEELYGRQWLIAYEAHIKGWLPSRDGTDYVISDPNFGFLNAHGVEFYNPVRLRAAVPTGPSTVPGLPLFSLPEF